MPRLMSVSLTEDAVRERRKTVTRRPDWTFLKPGDRLKLCRKVMGRRNGEPLVRLAEVEVVDVRRERLEAITEEDVAREGFPEWGPLLFVAFFCERMKCLPSDIVTRIEWRYLDPCCDLHNRNCEPPSELCCWGCTEANHPNHRPGERCVMTVDQALPGVPSDPRDLLTDEQRERLDRDLTEMAKLRRRAAAEAGGVWMP